VLCEERNTTACYKGKAKDATRGARAADRQADLAAYLRRFMVEVVEHFDVIAEEPDRTDQPVTNTRMTSFFLPRRAAETVPTESDHRDVFHRYVVHAQSISCLCHVMDKTLTWRSPQATIDGNDHGLHPAMKYSTLQHCPLAAAWVGAR